MLADNQLKEGVPASSYCAMGMQEASRGNGEYNGFNFYTYQDTNLDQALTKERNHEAIRERLLTFKEQPFYAFQFYKDKFLSQWTDGSFASRQATLSHYGRTQFFQEVYEGKYANTFMQYCNIYQLFIYIGGFLFVLQDLLAKEQTHNGRLLFIYIGMIGIIGGFLFHMVWEANSRYILPYFLLLLPYSAIGYCRQIKKERFYTYEEV